MSEKKDYIERVAAIKTLIAAIHNDGYQGESNIERHELREDEIEDAILSIPAADVEPVVRGAWKPDNRIFGAWHCSVCGESALCNGIEEEVKSAFCPYCGAKMNVN